MDVYFDNVGGPITDTVFRSLNTGGRIVVCGQIDQYNDTQEAVGPRMLWQLHREAGARGGLHGARSSPSAHEEGRRQLAEWLREGRLKYRETVVDGIENTPRAFIGLFSGENIGKMLVRVSAEGAE